ncbi:hypothetical protein N431DRAFT_480383 [Stipitochalara longipes BDJ]|nr:hypothetical protein N431DRAFT_480383 [Stipitochalara longipes BDJ]
MGIFKLSTWFAAVYFASISRCETPGFIFPANDTLLDAPLSDITVHFNDSILIEYTGNPGGIVLLGQYCYASSQNPLNESSDNPQTFYLSSSFNNTGILLWNVGNGNDGNYTDVNFCRLSLMNFTISECSWGPFGLTSFNQSAYSDSYNTFDLTSALFSMLPPKGEPATITNSARSSSETGPTVTATAMGKAVCPPSGIPAMPIVSPVPQIDLYPKMLDGVVFPT